MKGETFTNFDIGIIVLLITLVCGFLIFMILRLIEIFTSSKDLKHEKEKMDIEILKMEKELVQKARKKKGETEKKIPEKKTTEKTTKEAEKNKRQKKMSFDDEDSFSDIDRENIVQF